MVKKQSIKLAASKTDVDDPAVGDEMMDILLKFAERGMAETEKMMKEQPELFTADEIKDFQSNKSTFAKAPEVVDSYKKKVQEFNHVNDAAKGFVTKCDKIVRNHKIRQSFENHDFVDPHSQKAKDKAKNEARLDAGMIRYNEDGEMIIEPKKK